MGAGSAAPPAPPHPDPDLWVAVGIVGIVLFLIGIYQPALARLPYPGAAQVALAVAGAATAVLGFTYAQRARAARPAVVPRRPTDVVLRLGPSAEIYDPRTAIDPTLSPEEPTGESAESPAP